MKFAILNTVEETYSLWQAKYRCRDCQSNILVLIGSRLWFCWYSSATFWPDFLPTCIRLPEWLYIVNTVFKLQCESNKCIWCMQAICNLSMKVWLEWQARWAINRIQQLQNDRSPLAVVDTTTEFNFVCQVLFKDNWLFEMRLLFELIQYLELHA